jgi:sugar/nucleoside kinase (ribokinase family)
MNQPRTILCFGEALWDVRRDGRTPGGAPMNVALRLASLGGAPSARRPQRDVVDTIGCGDSFLASWLLDLVQGSDPGRALRRACALGALVATAAGANPAVDAARVDALAGP